MLTLSGLARVLFGDRTLCAGHYFRASCLPSACQELSSGVTDHNLYREIFSSIENNVAVAELTLA